MQTDRKQKTFYSFRIIIWGCGVYQMCEVNVNPYPWKRHRYHENIGKIGNYLLLEASSCHSVVTSQSHLVQNTEKRNRRKKETFSKTHKHVLDDSLKWRQELFNFPIFLSCFLGRSAALLIHSCFGRGRGKDLW